MRELYELGHLNDELEPKAKVDEDDVIDLQYKYHSAKTQNEVRVVFLYLATFLIRIVQSCMNSIHNLDFGNSSQTYYCRISEESHGTREG